MAEEVFVVVGSEADRRGREEERVEVGFQGRGEGPGKGEPGTGKE